MARASRPLRAVVRALLSRLTIRAFLAAAAPAAAVPLLAAAAVAASTLAAPVLAASALAAGEPPPGGRDWPMLAHDPARSGATPAEVRPPFERKWHRLFPEEGIMAGVQPVVWQGKVFLGTLRGIVHAMDAETGVDAWTFQAAGPVLHACAAGEGKVFFGCADGGIHALEASSGRRAWSVQTEAAVWNAPLLDQGTVVAGSRDGRLYAIDAAEGNVRWTADLAAPILSSPAADPRSGRVFAAGEDLRVHALELSSGRPLWRSDPLPGVTFRGYHPVVAPDGSVMITTAPAISLASIEPLLLDMVKEVFGDFASWRHTREENVRLRRENFERMEKPGTYHAQLEYLRRRLAAEPAYQTFFVLDPATGKQKFVAPVVYAESMNGTGAPPVVTPSGRVVVKFQALLRSRYEHYSPFLNVGWLDTASGHLEPLMDQSRTYGWHDSLLLVHDEQSQLAVSGRVLINTHQDNVNGLDLETLKGYSEPFCRNIHEPAPGEAAAIWSRLLAGEELPAGKEWLQRGTAVYGGGSVIDTSVSIAGDSFYYLPTHEISSGAALIAYRMKPDAPAGKPAQPVADKVEAGCWKKIQDLPWDWDLLELSRLRPLLESLPGRLPGTRSAPLDKQARARAAAIPDEEIDRLAEDVPARPPEPASVPARAGEGTRLEEALAGAVRELLSADWQPFFFPAGKHPVEAYRLFTDPADTVEALALAYPHLPPSLKEESRAHVSRLDYFPHGGKLRGGQAGQGPPGTAAGPSRTPYREPPASLVKAAEDVRRDELGRLYPLWLWAQVSGEWTRIEGDWKEIRGLLGRPAAKAPPDCGNSRLAGLIAYARIARRLGDRESAAEAAPLLRAAARERLVYELAYTRGGLIGPAPVLRSIASRWRHLTPEVGRFLSRHARDTHQRLMSIAIDHHRPTWWLAWNVETLWRNECPFEFPTLAVEVFDARSFILEEPAERLERFLDLPWCRADVFYIRKLALCLRARARPTSTEAR